MLYFENDSFEKQIELVEYFSIIGNHDVMFWIFPESKCRNICDLRLSPKDLVEGNPVTTYGDGSMGKRTRRTTLDSNLVEKIRECKNDIKENCDSIVIYE